MRRYSAKIDDNQPAIVRVLRHAGCSVQPLSLVGKGCPDLLVGSPLDGKNYLLEVKNREGRAESHRALTPAQQDWHASWHGALAIVHTPEEAVDFVFRGKKPPPT